ncbi:hypothetical protein AW736_04130 [Termitidicoccus mucosus]|uniref:Uncharacterized protein n=1 Tax=Termitidicoccus mucosus TaxID=1184151 RepID=A0A178IMY3_9BACT|nr:hypothetical protein AW736_04130 [Opitutaceae bacterium TSB47]
MFQQHFCNFVLQKTLDGFARGARAKHFVETGPKNRLYVTGSDFQLMPESAQPRQFARDHVFAYLPLHRVGQNAKTQFFPSCAPPAPTKVVQRP